MSSKPTLNWGWGIGLVAEQSSGENEEGKLVRLDTRHLFDANTVWLGLKARSTAAQLCLALYRAL